MKKLLLGFALSVLVATTGFAQSAEELTDVEFYGYKVTHHMGAMVQHIDEFGFNTFDKLFVSYKN